MLEQAKGNRYTLVITLRKGLTPGLVVGGIGWCEWVFVYRDAGWGITLALFMSIAIYAAVSLWVADPRLADCLESLVLLPLYILFTSSLPWFFIDQLYLIPAVYSLVTGLALVHAYRKRIDLRPLFLVPRRRVLQSLWLGLALGIPLGAVEYFIITPTPAFPSFGLGNLLRDLVYMVFFVGLGEELLFRGLIQRDLSRLLGWKPGLVLTGVTFGIMHLTWRSVPEVFFTTGAGLVFGYVYHRTGNLVAPVLIHGIGNVTLISVMPYLAR